MCYVISFQMYYFSYFGHKDEDEVTDKEEYIKNRQKYFNM